MLPSGRLSLALSIPRLTDLKQDIGNMLNNAIAAVEDENDALAGVLKNNQSSRSSPSTRSDECAIRPKTDSLHHRKWPEQSMLHVTRVTLELRFLRGHRCEEGAQGDQNSPARDYTRFEPFSLSLTNLLSKMLFA